ncbi:uncharacterized protein JCM15063_004718 [Sporobolomyces koalae]|uniref:uncharacterized protein n=1 Tax=Sporobolomyces koalae TaxID=500713 RepID=UPI00317AC4F2
MASPQAARASAVDARSLANTTTAAHKVVRIVFLALLLDLLAFTMPLPLFPRIIDDFVQHEATRASTHTPTLLSGTLSTVRSLRSYLTSFSSVSTSSSNPARFDLTLLGGLLGSTFSFCQFLVSPLLGGLSDKYGRKKVLLASMVGNILSASLWLASGSRFELYALSRIVGGLSEGNVQLSIASITDVTTPATRSKSLALVGIAFSVAFTLGPSLGAYFAARDWFHLSSSPTIDLPLVGPIGLNSYAVPAAITLALLTVETLYLTARLPETKGWKLAVTREEKSEPSHQQGTEETVPRTVAERRERLGKLESIHFGFLFFFSGAEFTITFLTNNLFDFSNAQNGRLLGFIGILSSLLQGGYVRRASSTRRKTFSLAVSGIKACQLSLFLLSSLPFLSRQQEQHSTTTVSMVVLYLAAAGLAYVSATVVNSLNSLASLETDVDSDSRRDVSGKSIEKGKALGKFRSKGQLGRALGPLFATGVYWCASPAVAYLCCAVGTMVVARRMARLRERDTVGHLAKNK